MTRTQSILLALLLFPSVSTAQTATTQPQRPTFGVLLAPGIVPCAIHVDGLRFQLAAGTPLTAWYQWDFGDPGTKYNTLTGFTAAHIYDHTGRFTITLTVTDEANHVQSATATIIISADTRRRVYVSPEGSDANTGQTPIAPFRSLTRACKSLTDNTEILLKAGAKYDMTSSVAVDRHDILISRYDDGPDPILMRIKGESGSTFGMGPHSDGVTIQHLVFDSPNAVDPKAQAPKTGISGIRASGRNITVRNCTFLNIDDAVNANGSPKGLLVQDCTSPLITGLRGYLLWGQGSDIVCLGNFAANSTREHNVRISGAERLLIAYNNFTNLDRRPEDKSDESKGCIELHKSSYSYVAHNIVKDGPIRTGPLGGTEDPNTATDWVVIDGNTVIDSKIDGDPGSHHIMIRNNIIQNQQNQAIVLIGPDKQGRTSSDFSILNNTAINNSDSGAFLKVWGHVEGIILKNNLFIAPGLKPGANGTSAVNTVEDDLTDFIEIERNIWPMPTAFTGHIKDGVCVVGKKDTNEYRNPAAWAKYTQVKEDKFVNVQVDDHNIPGRDSAAAGYALPTPAVRRDHDDHPRSAETPTIGALEISPEPATTQSALK